MHSIKELEQRAVDMLFDLEVDTGNWEQVQVYLNLVGIAHCWNDGYTEVFQDALRAILENMPEKEGDNG